MPRWILSLALLALLIYGLFGVYEVKSEESGVAFVFGRIVDPQVPSGIHWNLPPPMGHQVIRPTRLSQVMRIGQGGTSSSTVLSGREDLWFTGGASVVECQLDIQYSIARLDQFLLSHENPEAFMKLAAERAVTQFLGSFHVDDVLTTQRRTLVDSVTKTLQATLTDLSLGLQVQDVSIVQLSPPKPGGVSDSFRQVQSARSEREREIENAKSDAAGIVIDAQAEAQSLDGQARASRFARIEQARARAERFLGLSKERQLAPEVMDTRLYRDIVPTALERAKLFVVPNDTKGTVER